jgi:hypothetical protein
MGGATSTSNTSQAFNSSLSNTLVSSLTSVAASSNSYAVVNQIIDLSGLHCSGNLNVSGISQTAKVVVNLKSIAQNTSSTQLKSMIKSAVDAVVKNNNTIKAGFLGGNVSTNNSQTVVNNNVANLAASINSTTFTQLASFAAAQQKIDIKGSYAVDCNISNISQNAGIDILAQSLATAITNNAIDMGLVTGSKLDATNTNDVTTTGPIQELGKAINDIIHSIFAGLTGPIIIMFVIFLIAAAVSLFFMYRTSSTVKSLLPTL